MHLAERVDLPSVDRNEFRPESYRADQEQCGGDRRKMHPKSLQVGPDPRLGGTEHRGGYFGMGPLLGEGQGDHLALAGRQNQQSTPQHQLSFRSGDPVKGLGFGIHKLLKRVLHPFSGRPQPVVAPAQLSERAPARKAKQPWPTAARALS
jgi:hypothetical protein